MRPVSSSGKVFVQREVASCGTCGASVPLEFFEEGAECICGGTVRRALKWVREAVRRRG